MAIDLTQTFEVFSASLFFYYYQLIPLDGELINWSYELFWVGKGMSPQMLELSYESLNYRKNNKNENKSKQRKSIIVHFVLAS